MVFGCPQSALSVPEVTLQTAAAKEPGVRGSQEEEEEGGEGGEKAKQEGHCWQRVGAAEGSCSRQVRQPGNRLPSPGSTRTRCSGGAEGTGGVVALGITWWPWE